MKTLMLMDEARNGHSASLLSASYAAEAVLSPYFQRSTLQEIGSGQGYSLIPEPMRATLYGVQCVTSGGIPDHGTVFAMFIDETTGNTPISLKSVQFDIIDSTGDTYIQTTAEAAVNAYASGQGYTMSGGLVWALPTPSEITAAIAAAIPPAPSSYQMIVTQTGTAAPAVSGSMTPMNTYAGAPTFTWARTGAGVYTLTASSAVFNTSGKTSVFISPLQNLNAQAKCVVTSTTVLTFTTAVSSVAVLGLLGLTTTPTDALLTQTMVYVQTYP